METTVAVLGVADAEQLLALQDAAYAPSDEAKQLPSRRQSLEALTADLGDEQMLSLGLRDGDALVAAVRAYVGGPTAQVGRLCVHPDQQGRGLATALLTELEARIPEHVREVRIFTDEDAAASRHFYAKLGYVEAGHEGTESGFQIVRLSKQVVAAQPA